MSISISNKKLLKTFGIGAIVLLFLYLGWYDLTYSMGEAKAFEVNSPELNQKVLIVTQGSEYKNQVVTGIADYYRKKKVHLRVIDVYSLEETSLDEYNAICLIHTWEVWMPPYPIRVFMRNSPDTSRLAVHTTSGDGTYKLENVDAITGASVLEDAPHKAHLLIERINYILRKQQNEKPVDTISAY